MTEDEKMDAELVVDGLSGRIRPYTQAEAKAGITHTEEDIEKAERDCPHILAPQRGYSDRWVEECSCRFCKRRDRVARYSC